MTKGKGRREGTGGMNSGSIRESASSFHGNPGVAEEDISSWWRQPLRRLPDANPLVSKSAMWRDRTPVTTVAASISTTPLHATSSTDSLSSVSRKISLIPRAHFICERGSIYRRMAIYEDQSLLMETNRISPSKTFFPLQIWFIEMAVYLNI